jgi:hypothetical protein
MWTVVLLLALGALVVWLASRLTWTWTTQLTPLHGRTVVRQAGSQVEPGLVALALLALAGIAAVLAIGGWFRRIVGGLVVVAGLAVLWIGVSGLPGVFGAHPAGYPRWQVLGGHALALVGGLLLIAAGALVVRAAARLPKLGGSYQTPSAAKRAATSEAQLWQALSEGKDPTQD